MIMGGEYHPTSASSPSRGGICSDMQFGCNIIVGGTVSRAPSEEHFPEQSSVLGGGAEAIAGKYPF